MKHVTAKFTMFIIWSKIIGMHGKEAGKHDPQ